MRSSISRSGLSVVLALGLMASTSIACPTPDGDLDLSGDTTIADVQCLLLTVLSELGGPSEPLPSCLAVSLADANLNCSGGVDTSDVLISISFVLNSPLATELDADLDGCVDACQDPCSLPNPSDCCCGGGSVGCDDTTCQTLICGLDAFCCESSWDNICLAEAAAFCPICGGETPECTSDTQCAPTDPCTSSSCDITVDLNPGTGKCVSAPIQCDDGNPCTAEFCDPATGCVAENQCTDGCSAAAVPTCAGCDCEACVCALQPSCCTGTWDASCVALCDGECGSCGAECGDGQCELAEGEDFVNCPEDCNGDGSCCGLQTTPGCNAPACQACVCAADSLCCELAWDSLCVDAAVAGDCATNCACDLSAGGDCCFASAGVGCSDSTCSTCVCAQDAWCCDATWDELCASAAAGACAASCPCGGDSAVPECCSAKGGPGCPSDSTCETCVCDGDGFCCSTLWDENCAASANSDCATNCGCAGD